MLQAVPYSLAKNKKQSEEEEEEPETVTDNCCVSPTGLLICLN